MQQQYRSTTTTATPTPFQPNNLFNNPVVSSFAVQYGTGLAEQGKEKVNVIKSNYIEMRVKLQVESYTTTMRATYFGRK